RCPPGATLPYHPPQPAKRPPLPPSGSSLPSQHQTATIEPTSIDAAGILCVGGRVSLPSGRRSLGQPQPLPRFMQHFLNFLPLPQGHGSFRPTCFSVRRNGVGLRCGKSSRSFEGAGVGGNVGCAAACKKVCISFIRRSCLACFSSV